jgi:hypothetical protein
VPNTLLAPAGLAAAKAQQGSWSAERGKHKGGAANAVLWFPPSVVTPSVGTAADFVAVTATPNVLSLLMQHVSLSVRGSATSGCWIGSLDFPVSGGPAKLKVDVRGVAEQPKGAKTSIFIVIGAVLKSIAFDDERSGDFTETFEATIGDEPVQTITIILLAERLAKSDDVLLGVDSLDIIAVK